MEGVSFTVVFFGIFGILMKHAASAPPREDLEPRLRFYKSNESSYEEVPLWEAPQRIASGCIDGTKRTVFFAHGFTGRPEGEAVTTVVRAYLSTGAHNVVLFNWEKMATKKYPKREASYGLWAAPNARNLGRRFAKVLVAMSEAGLDLARTQLVGHSLGAQLFGIAGLTAKQAGYTLPWITGLDPAKPLFEGRRLSLSGDSAAFVDIVHTDPIKYAYERSRGTVDYWPNAGGRAQPGCSDEAADMFSPEDLCSHNRSWQLWAEAVRSPGCVVARRMSASAHNSTHAHFGEDPTLTLGQLPLAKVSGDFSFNTNSKPPYAQGVRGI